MVRYAILDVGSPSFPIYTVWAEPEDENGFTIEHEMEQLAKFTTYKQAAEFIRGIEEGLTQ